MNQDKIKICEIFESIQGEGKFSGYPMLFIRTSGCTRNCWFCDTKYALTEGTSMTIDEIVQRIEESKLHFICWTGGEPLLQRKAIKEVIKRTKYRKHHIETNGDSLAKEDIREFHYIVVSPKEESVAKVVSKTLYDKLRTDVKVVTDLEKEGVDMIKYATILMPLTFYDKKKDLEVLQKVWQYCVKNNLRFSPRLQYFVWDKKRKI